MDDHIIIHNRHEAITNKGIIAGNSEWKNLLLPEKTPNERIHYYQLEQWMKESTIISWNNEWNNESTITRRNNE